MTLDHTQVVSAVNDACFLLDAWLPRIVHPRLAIQHAEYESIPKEGAVAELEHEEWSKFCDLVWGLVDFDGRDAFADPPRIWGGVPDPVLDQLASPGSRRDWLIAHALSGHRLAHHALCHVAELMTSDGMPLPLWLQGYVVRVAKDGRARRKRGRSRVDNSLRDQAITWVVLVVAVRYDLPPTRNPAGTTVSACSIVATALSEPKIYMTEGNLNRIWLSGNGPDLLTQERAMTNAFGPNLWTLTAPMGRALNYPLREYLTAKCATQMMWSPLFSDDLPSSKVKEAIEQERKEAQRAAEAARKEEGWVVSRTYHQEFTVERDGDRWAISATSTFPRAGSAVAADGRQAQARCAGRHT